MSKAKAKMASAVIPDKQVLDSLKVLEKKKGKILLFLGNGINEPGTSLSTKIIVEAFVKKAASQNPREYEEKKEVMKRLVNTLSSNGSAPDMTAFMSDFKDMENVKEQFVSYVIESCCNEEPGPNHYLILILSSLLEKYGHGKHQIVAFTTNYDNLLERAHIGSGRSSRNIYLRNRMSLSNYPLFKYSPRALARLYLKPTYSLNITPRKDSFSVVPIHGSIRVCRCPGCGRILSTEAAALERKMCVYCGAEIPRVIVPTTEGEADKKVLSLFEDWISDAAVMFFIGYGFGDPHIMERIKGGLSRNKYGGNLRPINLCHCLFPEDKLDSKKSGDCINISNDITLALAKITSMIGSKTKGEFGPMAVSIANAFEESMEGIGRTWHR